VQCCLYVVYSQHDGDSLCCPISVCVWEFISSQQAVDMVAHCKNPNEACKILVDKSTKLWHEEEDLRDDSVCPTSARVAQFLLARIVAALSWRWGRCRHPYAVRRRRSSLFPLPNRALQSLRWSRFCPSDCHEQVERVTRGRTLRCCL
jgi:hypothetical protein